MEDISKLKEGDIVYIADKASEEKTIKRAVVKRVIKDGFLSGGELCTLLGYESVEIRYDGMESWQSAGSVEKKNVFSRAGEAAEYLTRDLLEKKARIISNIDLLEKEIEQVDKEIDKIKESIIFFD